MDHARFDSSPHNQTISCVAQAVAELSTPFAAQHDQMAGKYTMQTPSWDARTWCRLSPAENPTRSEHPGPKTQPALPSRTLLECPSSYPLPHLSHGADLVACAVRAAWVRHGVPVVPARAGSSRGSLQLRAVSDVLYCTKPALGWGPKLATRQICSNVAAQHCHRAEQDVMLQSRAASSLEFPVVTCRCPSPG